MSAQESYLAKRIDRTKPKGIRVAVYGQEGSGKTTFAASAPKALLIQVEDGSVGLDPDLDITILPLVKCFEDVQGILREVGELVKTSPTLPFETIIIDSATALERLMSDYTIRCDPKYATQGNKLTMESCHDGFGRGHIFCNDVMTRFLATLDWFIAKGINVIFTCHAMAITEKDTIAGEEYTMMDCALFSPKNGKTIGRRELLKQWCDILGYLHTPVYVTATGKKDNQFKTAIAASDVKLMGLHSNPKYAAKNRFALQEPLQIPKINGWEVLQEAIRSGRTNYQAPVDYTAPVVDTQAAAEANYEPPKPLDDFDSVGGAAAAQADFI